MIPSFMLNLLLAVVYVALLGEVAFFDFAIGFVIGFVIVSLINRTRDSVSYPGRCLALLRFAGYFLVILTKANLQVAWEIITPGFTFKPRIVRYPVDDLNDIEITTLANAITLTPGTLSADVDDEGKNLYIHCMYAGDRDAAIAELDALRHRLLREVFDHDC